MIRSIAPYVAAEHLSRASSKLILAAEELCLIDPETALSLRVMAADLETRAARLEAAERAALKAADAQSEAYDLAHPV